MSNIEVRQQGMGAVGALAGRHSARLQDGQNIFRNGQLAKNGRLLREEPDPPERALMDGAEIVLHAYRDGTAPGRERLIALGLPHKVVNVSGTSEDAAFLLAHGKGADLIVAVGSHGNLREFLDKGRSGMASTFLVRLRVGETLVDAKGVSRLYRTRIRLRDSILLMCAAVAVVAVVVALSPPLRLEARLLWDQFRVWLFGLTH